MMNVRTCSTPGCGQGIPGGASRVSCEPCEPKFGTHKSLELHKFFPDVREDVW